MERGPLFVRRCTKCVLPGNYPGIQFNKAGICSYCLEFKPHYIGQRRQELQEIIERARKNDSKYQCVVPFSGGKDSSYVLYYMRKVCSLRVLAVNFDNGFRSSMARENLAALSKRLGVEIVSIKLSWPLMSRLYAAFMKDAGEFCSVCNSVGYLGIMTYIMHHMDLFGSEPLVVSGWVRYLEEMPNVYAFDIKYFHDIISRAGLADPLIASGFVDQRCLAILMNVSDPRTLNGDQSIPFTFIALPEYVYWDLNKISKTLRNELDWIAPSAMDDTHFDCTAYPVAQYLEKKKYGFSQSTITYSAMIRHGQMARETALSKLEQESFERPKEFSDFLNMLRLSDSDVNWNGDWYPQRQ
jgi:hypothetical protein